MVLLRTLKALALVPTCRHFFFNSLLSLSASSSFCMQGKHFRKATGNQFSEGGVFFIFALSIAVFVVDRAIMTVWKKKRKANRGFILWKEQPGIPRCWIYRHSRFLCIIEDAHSSLHEERRMKQLKRPVVLWKLFGTVASWLHHEHYLQYVYKIGWWYKF